MGALKKTFKPIDSAFAILFMLLIALAFLHVTTISDMAASTSALNIAPQLERFRAVEGDLRMTIGHLEDTSLSSDAKLALIDSDLENIELHLRELGISGLNVPGLTRLVEPAMHIREVRSQLFARDDPAALLAPHAPVERAVKATLFVVRNNITRLGEELSTVTASQNGSYSRTRDISILGAVAAVMIFWPVRLMARRAAARPIEHLKEATQAVAEERWMACNLDSEPEDSMGELVVAFNTMAGKLRESSQRRLSAFRGTLASLVQTIEAKDHFTFNHSCNVSKFAELLARALRLPESDVAEIAFSAVLHDIGKVGIPDAIIQKPGKLTAEEFSAIEHHPTIGCRIVSPLEDSEWLLPPIRHHHEHWDGSGYPDGLSGEAIPLTARILSVADVFEALISDRPYRQRMPINNAVEVLRNEAAKSLDPGLVETFIADVLPEIRELIENAATVQQARAGSPQSEPTPSDAAPALSPQR